MREMVAEIHRLGHYAVVFYNGGVRDRLEQIVSIGADALMMESSMKGYVNEVGEVAEILGERMTLLGNLNVVTVLQEGSEKALEEEVEHQIRAGQAARGFIMCTGSPITPLTSVERVRRYIDLAHGTPVVA
jgi:uroporphyrinogen-III decarboxylase